MWSALRDRPRTAAFAAVPVLFVLIVLIPCLHGLIGIRMADKQPSLHLLDRNHGFIAAVENPDGEFGYWEMPAALPGNLVLATLAAEDRRFREHGGIDFRAVAAAFYGNLSGRRSRRGASTLAMQVARLQRGGGTGWYGKIRDAVTATGLTVLHGRDRVLRRYFLIAPYGNRIAGAACASRRYFRKPVQDLSLAEAALLASLPKAPSRFNLFRAEGAARAKARAALILERARAYGWIPESVRDEALSELASLNPPAKELRHESDLHFLREAAARFAARPHPQGEIRTTLDARIQDTLRSALRREVPKLLDFQAGNSAGMVVDARTGEVLAYIGSSDYFDPRGGAIDFARVPRSTGSLLKPFIYALGMESQGYTAASILTDLGFDFGSGSRSFVPENADRRYLGPVLYKNALANSRNIPAVQVLKAVGVEEFYRMCIALGLAPDDGKAGHYGLGLSIGGLYCSLQKICAAYLSLANQGERRGLVWSLDSAGEPGSGRVLSPENAMQTLRFLSDPVARLPGFPRGGNLEYPFAVAVKTGTSEGFRDSWCVGMSDRYLVGVWIGNADFSPTKDLTGYEGAAGIVRTTLLALHPDRADGMRDTEFPPPPGYRPVPICRLTGKRADRSTPFATTEYFRPGAEPLEFSDAQKLLPVDKRNGLLAFPDCRVPLEYRRFTVLPPEFRDWAMSQGLEVPPERYSPACGGAPMADDYAIAIASPRSGSRFFIDPEMPAGQSLLPLEARVFPPPKSVLWFVNGEEYREVAYPFTLLWPMRPGAFEFSAAVPGTAFRSAPVRFEVF